MKRPALRSGIVAGALALAVAIAGLGTSASAAKTAAPPGAGVFSDASAITNPWLPISDHRRCKLSGNDLGQKLVIKRRLLNRTERFQYKGQQVDAAVVHDVVRTGSGRRIEATTDWFAQDDAGTVYYFAEHVNEYRPGKPVNHEGQWRLGRDAKHPGVLMPANPRVGDSFVSENVPQITHERDTVVSKRNKMRVAGHTYRNVITVRENAKPPPEIEYKHDARGVGVITEANGGVKLHSCS